MQTKRIGHFCPIPGVPISARQLTYGISSMAARLMGESAPESPEQVRLIPSDWLPEKERRVGYLLHALP